MAVYISNITTKLPVTGAVSPIMYEVNALHMNQHALSAGDYEEAEHIQLPPRYKRKDWQ